MYYRGDVADAFSPLVRHREGDRDWQSTWPSSIVWAFDEESVVGTGCHHVELLSLRDVGEKDIRRDTRGFSSFSERCSHQLLG